MGTETITRGEVEAALTRIRAHLHVTPVLKSARLGDETETALHFKCESMQRTGSFKVRGALNAMLQLSPADRAKGVVTVSAGNHAQALAWAARFVGAECVTVMPEGASRSKISATEGYGGRVELVGGERQRAFDRAREIASQGRMLVHPFEDPHVAAGQGTVAVELLDQIQDLDAVIVPIGGGGLIAGIATVIAAVRPGVKVYGVEPAGAATMRAALDAGAPQPISPNTVADGLAAPIVGAMTLEAVRRHVADVVIVSDDEILDAMRSIMTYAKLVVEPAGAAALAALRSGRIRLAAGANVAVILSGGNVDVDRLKVLL